MEQQLDREVQAEEQLARCTIPEELTGPRGRRGHLCCCLRIAHAESERSVAGLTFSCWIAVAFGTA